MLSLFKGELSLYDIMYRLPYKRLYDLKESRQNKLIKESKEIEAMERQSESDDIRNRILAP